MNLLLGKAMRMVFGTHPIKYLDRRTVLMFVSLLAVLWLQAPRLFDPFSVDEDFRTFYWMSKFQDPTLFPDDPLQSTIYTNIPMPWGDWPIPLASPGYGLLYYAASFAIPIVLFSKLLVFLLMPMTVWYLYEFGKATRSSGLGVTLAAGFIFLNLASPTSVSLLTGLQRAFAFTLIIALIYYLQQQKHIAAILTIMIATLIYAPMAVLGLVIWGLSTLRISQQLGLRLLIDRRSLGTAFVSGFLTVLIIVPTLLINFSHIFTRPETVAAAKQTVAPSTETSQSLWDNPTFQDGGRKALFLIFPFVGRLGLFDEPLDALHAFILLAIGSLIFLVRGRRALDLPYVVYCVLGASLVMFALSWLAIFLTNSFILYLPSRYTRVGLVLFLMMFVLFNGRDFFKEAAIAIRRHQQKLIWLIGGIEALALGLILLYPSERTTFLGLNMKWLLASAGLIFGGLGAISFKKRLSTMAAPANLGHSPAGRFLIGIVVIICLSAWLIYAPMVTKASFLDPEPAERELLSFLETLPKDTLLAGTPCALDSVSLFAKRQVLFSCEHVGLDENLIYKALEAYYTDDPRAIVGFCQENSVDYLVVDTRTYSKEYLAREQIFFEPYNQALLAHISGQDTFALAQIPDDLKIFQSGDFFVVPCAQLAVQ